MDATGLLSKKTGHQIGHVRGVTHHVAKHYIVGQLESSRYAGFEQVIFHLSQGDVWKVADHPDQKTYTGQKVYFVVIEGYVYLVPHICEKQYIFLKTIIPSRKATKEYLSEQEENNEIR